MAGTTIVEARKALVAVLKTRPGLAGVYVTYAWDGDDRTARDAIWTAFAATGPEDSAETRSAVPVLRANPKRREEDYVFGAVCEVRQMGTTQQQVDERAAFLLAEVENALAADPTLALPAISWAVLRGFRPVAGLVSGALRACRFEASVSVKARLL